MASILQSFLQSLLLLIALTYVFSYFLPHIKRLKNWQGEIFVGVIFGIFALISMANPSEVITGVIVDLRGPIIVVAAILMGWRAGAITALMVLGYRVYLGGVGAIVSYPATFALWVIGTWAYQHYGGKIPKTVFARFFVGFMAALQAYFWPWFFLPFEAAFNFFKNSAPVLLLMYPLVSYLLLDLLAREYDRHHLLAKLQESEDRFKAIFNQSKHFVGLLKPDGTVIESNASSLKFIGTSREAVINRPFWELHGWQASPAIPTQLREAIAQAAKGEFVRFNVEMQDKQGQTMVIDFSLTPVFDDAGKVILLIPEGRDISPEILAENRRLELAFANERVRVLKQFIQDASHNLRTPLAVIQTSLYLLRRHSEMLQDAGADLPNILEKTLSHPPKIQRALDDLTSIVEGMLNLLTLDEQDELNQHYEDISAISQAEIEALRPLAESKNQSFQVALPSAAIWMNFDAALWRQVVQNLLENAIRYTPSNGKIQVALCSTETEFIFEVVDTGIGIAEADMQHLYERFFRAENARVKQNVGNGLGLPIVKRIVELHQGRIEVESKLNEGSSFRVFLPLKA